MNIVILGSGRGSNAAAILKAFAENKLGNAKPVAIISDKPNAPILELGIEQNIPGHYLHPGKFKTKLEGDAEQDYIDFIKKQNADLVVLAGFMRVIKPAFLKAFENKIINLHPSLLPSFKGLHAIEQAIEYGVKITGCTVHYVTEEIDSGAILGQQAVIIEPDDTLENLEEKIHAAEHELLPRVIAQLSE